MTNEGLEAVQGEKMENPGPNQAEQLENAHSNQEAQNGVEGRNQGDQMENPGPTQGGEHYWDRQPDQSGITDQWRARKDSRSAYRER